MELLPVGSVVLLEGGEKRLMIYGILQLNAEDESEYDYLGCLYPEGYINSDHTYMFNHKDIQKVEFIGFVDSEFQMFRSNLQNMLDQETLKK